MFEIKFVIHTHRHKPRQIYLLECQHEKIWSDMCVPVKRKKKKNHIFIYTSNPNWIPTSDRIIIIIIILTVKVLSSLSLSFEQKNWQATYRVTVGRKRYHVYIIASDFIGIATYISHCNFLSREMIAFKNSTRTFALWHPQWIPQSFLFFTFFFFRSFSQRTQIADTSTLIRAINCAVIIFRWLPFGATAVATHIFHTNYLICGGKRNNPNTNW